MTLAYDSLGRKVSETQTNRSAFTFTYNPTTLAPATESIAYDLNADGIPDFSRVLDRSQDNLGRESGSEEMMVYYYDPVLLVKILFMDRVPIP